MEDTMRMVQKAAKALKCEIRGRVSLSGLTQAQWSVLNEIRCTAGKSGNTAAQLADVLAMDKPTVSGILKRLEGAGWIESKRDPKDGRSKLLKLTAKASGIIDGTSCCGRETAQKAFKGFSVAESERLKIYLNRIIRNMEE